jgi:hypothetical protein
MATKPKRPSDASDAPTDRMNPEDEDPSELDELTHREFLVL